MTDSPKQFDTEAFVTWNDPFGNRLCSINRDGTVNVQGVKFPDGTSQTSVGLFNSDLGTF